MDIVLELKYCELCGRQFLRPLDNSVAGKDKLCPTCITSKR